MPNNKELTKEKAEKQIEIKNAKEEIQDILSKCNYCGLCKALDPLWQITREESQSHRGTITLLQNKKITKDLFNQPLDRSCQHLCPFNIDLDQAIKKARKILNLQKKSPDFNKKIIKNLEEEKNPFSE